MLAMQYSFTLPADYDMDVIRHRIAANGSKMDGFDGLVFKAFLYACRSVHGPENLYAPFYLWAGSEPMNRFLCSDGFVALARAFGWPAIRTWSVVDAPRTADLRGATQATRETVQLAPHARLADTLAREGEAARAAVRDGARAAVAGFEPTGWTAVRTRLWSTEPAVAAGAQRYAIGHVATG
jgi:hypothetical protein